MCGSPAGMDYLLMSWNNLPLPIHPLLLSSSCHLSAYESVILDTANFQLQSSSQRVSLFCHLPLFSSLSRRSSTTDPLDPTAEPSSGLSGLDSPSSSLRQWTIGPVWATSHGSLTPRRDDRVKPVLVLRGVRWILLRITLAKTGTGPSQLSYGEWAEPSPLS